MYLTLWKTQCIATCSNNLCFCKQHLKGVLRTYCGLSHHLHQDPHIQTQIKNVTVKFARKQYRPFISFSL
ncbi:hypothetical protein XENTR_v10006293 [Xenopus tropicalis]|nr:hypothetical protein XENTR_v10006293 [Xenopus tropicalis]